MTWPSLQGDRSRTVVRSGPLTRYCTGQPTGGPSSSGETRETTLGKSSASSFSSLACSRSRAATSLAMTTACAKKSLASWTFERQVEPDRAAPDIGAPACDVWVRPSAWRRASRRPCRWRRSRRSAAGSDRRRVPGGRRRGRTAAAHRAAPAARGRNSRASRAIVSQRMPHRADQHRTKQLDNAARLLRRGLVRRLQEPDAEQRRKQYRDEPGHDQRDRDDGEDRERVFAGGAAVRSRSARSRRW